MMSSLMLRTLMLLLLSASSLHGKKKKNGNDLKWPDKYTYQARYHPITTDVQKHYTVYVSQNGDKRVRGIINEGSENENNVYLERKKNEKWNVKMYFPSYYDRSHQTSCFEYQNIDGSYLDRYLLPDLKQYDKPIHNQLIWGKIADKRVRKGKGKYGPGMRIDTIYYTIRNSTAKGKRKPQVKREAVPLLREILEYTNQSIIYQHDIYEYFGYTNEIPQGYFDQDDNVTCTKKGGNISPVLRAHGGSESDEIDDDANPGSGRSDDGGDITFRRKKKPRKKKQEKLPEHFDWRLEGGVTPVKHFGVCKASWAFSAVATLEGCYFQKTGKLIDMSEQYLINCFWVKNKTEGCREGSDPSAAFKFVNQEGGIPRESDEPYLEMMGYCKEKVNKIKFGVVKVKKLKSDKFAFKTALKDGPISAIIRTNHDFYFYQKGVFFQSKLQKLYYRFGVTIVGYGTDPKSGGYWIVKNIWGRQWGEDGYGLLSSEENTLGILDYGVQPVLKVKMNPKAHPKK